MSFEDDAGRVGGYQGHPEGQGQASAETRHAESPRDTQKTGAHHGVPDGQAERVRVVFEFQDQGDTPGVNFMRQS